jgi:hypothetical protein
MRYAVNDCRLKATACNAERVQQQRTLLCGGKNLNLYGELHRFIVSFKDGKAITERTVGLMAGGVSSAS